MADRVNLHQQLFAELQEAPVQEAKTGKRVTIVFATENDAFVEDPEAELLFILNQLASEASVLLRPGRTMTLQDSNGNTVGQAKWD